MRNTKNVHMREDVIFETRPQFFMYLKSAIFKFIIILLIIYFFRDLRSIVFTIQEYIVGLIQIPLVEGLIIFLLLVILVLFLWIIWDILSWRYTVYKFTDQRVIVERGVIRRKKFYIHYPKIHDIYVTQSLAERITLSGDIYIFGGHEHTELILEDVPRPKEVEDKINRIIEGDLLFEEDKPSKKRENKKNRKNTIISNHNKKFKRY